MTQTLVAGVAARDYVAAARVAGVGRLRILFRHVLPNVAEPLVVYATIGASGALLSFAGLSFLGLGVQSPSFDWGRLLFDGSSALYVNPAAALAPGAAVLLAGLSFALFGETVAKTFGVPVVAGLAAGPPVAGAAATRPSRPPTPTPPTGADVVLDVRDLEVTFPGPTGPIRPVRGVSLRRAPRRGGRRRRRVRLGQVAHRAGGLPPGRRRRRGRRRPGWRCSATTCAARTPRCGARCSAPRWRWCSRTR